MKFDYKVGVYIGRFNGAFHLAHYQNALDALFGLNQSPTVGHIVFMLGSAQESMTLKNPMTINERIAMIRSCFNDDIKHRLLFRPIRDTPTDTAWFTDIKREVDTAMETIGQPISSLSFNEPSPKIALMGVNKDASSWYLKGFPFWTSIGRNLPITDNDGNLISSTSIRDLIFGEDPKSGLKKAKQYLPDGTYNFLCHYIESDNFTHIKGKYHVK